MVLRGPDGSISTVDSDRDDLMIFEIVDKISKADIEWMARLVEAAFGKHEQIDMLLIMRNYQGLEIGAIVDHDAISAGLQSLSKVRRYAVVGAPLWAQAMINAFKFITPVESKTFDLEAERQAFSWISRGTLATADDPAEMERDKSY